MSCPCRPDLTPCCDPYPVSRAGRRESDFRAQKEIGGPQRDVPSAARDDVPQSEQPSPNPSPGPTTDGLGAGSRFPTAREKNSVGLIRCGSLHLAPPSVSSCLTCAVRCSRRACPAPTMVSGPPPRCSTETPPGPPSTRVRSSRTNQTTGSTRRRVRIQPRRSALPRRGFVPTSRCQVVVPFVSFSLSHDP